MSTAIWLAMPCYNEAERLDVDTIRAFVESCDDLSLILVDDGSSDSTGEIIDAAAAGHPRIHAMHLPVNGGKAEAVRRGMLAAPDDVGVVGFWDADLATPLSEVHSLRRVLDDRSQVDWVFGSRVLLLGRRIQRRNLRHYLGRVFATGASLALRMPVYDTQCGAKLFRLNDKFRHLLQLPFRSRWIFDVELLERLAAASGGPAAAAAMVYEQPLAEWRDVSGSKVSMAAFLRASFELLAVARSIRSSR